MSREEKKTYLAQYRNACRWLEYVEYMQNDYLLLYRQIEKGSSYDSPLDMERQQQKKELLERVRQLMRKVSRRKQQYEKLSAEIRDIISSVPNVQEADVLRMKYIDRMKVEEIADAMCYSCKSIHRIHCQALDNLNL